MPKGRTPDFIATVPTQWNEDGEVSKTEEIRFNGKNWKEFIVSLGMELLRAGDDKDKQKEVLQEQYANEVDKAIGENRLIAERQKRYDLAEWDGGHFSAEFRRLIVK